MISGVSLANEEVKAGPNEGALTTAADVLEGAAVAAKVELRMG